MKSNFIFATLVLLLLTRFSSHIVAQNNLGFNYQAIAVGSNGQVLNNANITVTFVIRQGSANGAIAYQEQHSNVSTSASGHFAVVIGTGQSNGALSDIDWGNGPYFLAVVINGNNVGTVRLESVPYSQYATRMKAENLIDVSDARPQVDQVLKWNGNQWTPADDATGDGGGTDPYTAGTGIAINGTVITNTGDTDPTNDITNTTDAGGDLGGTYPNPVVDGLLNRPLATTPPTNGQILKWNGSQWAPAEDATGGGGTDPYTAGTGIAINGTVITNTGDTDPTNDITNTTGAGGDLNGTYPNPTVDGLQNRPVAALAPTDGQVLKWNGAQWAPAEDATGGGGTDPYTAGTGIAINGTVITNTGDTDPSNDITNTTGAGGDLNGTYPNPTVDGLQNRPVAATAPANGQVLKWNGAQWAPAEDATGDDGTDPYTAGTGIAINGNVITNTGDTDPSNDITNTTNAGGDLNGTYPNPTVDGLQNRPVAGTAPQNGQVLTYTGNQWEPRDPAGGGATPTNIHWTRNYYTRTPATFNVGDQKSMFNYQIQASEAGCAVVTASGDVSGTSLTAGRATFVFGFGNAACNPLNGYDEASTVSLLYDFSGGGNGGIPYYQNFSISRIFRVNAGTTNMCVFGFNRAGNTPLSVGHINVTVQYFPDKYGTCQDGRNPY